MSYSVSQIKGDILSIFHFTNDNNIVNFNALINRAARDVLLDVNPQETKRTTSLGQVFNSIYDYSAPSDLKENQFIDIGPQVNRNPSQDWLNTFNKNFDLSKQGWKSISTIMWNGYVKYLRLTAPTFPAPNTLNACDAISSNGTWAVAGSASSLAVDTVNYVTNNASLSFNLAALGSTGSLVNSTMTSLDLSSLLNQGYFFLYTYLPTASSFSKVTLRWGSSASNYYSVDATVTQENTTFQNGWNLLSFPWLGATVVGSPDPSALTYADVIWTYDGTAQTGVRLSQITAILGQILNMEYYSRFLFRDGTTGAFQETVTDDTNLINLENNNLLTYKVAELTAQQVQGLDASFYDGPYFQKLYADSLQKYRLLYPSETTKTTNSYYGMTKPQAYPRVRNW